MWHIEKECRLCFICSGCNSKLSFCVSSVMGFCNVTAKNIGYGIAVFIWAQKDIYFMPFNSVFSIYRIFQISNAAGFIFSLTKCRNGTEIFESIFKVIGNAGKFLSISKFIFICSFKNFNKLFHACTNNQTVSASFQIQRKIIAVKSFCNIRKNLVFCSGSF